MYIYLGAFFEREANVRKGERKLIHGDVVLDDLIVGMIRTSAVKRFTIHQCLHHPYYWSSQKQLNFLVDVSDRLEKEDRDCVIITQLEKHAQKIVDNWMGSIGSIVLADLGKFRKYVPTSLIDLLRALRNKKNHYQELPDLVKKELGSLPTEFLKFFTSKYPRLLIYVYNVFKESDLAREAMFASYLKSAEN